ncbi:hypothetical protein J15TS10_35530 [Paenibacillus woosongensis]|uniref:Secreted protein n=1 Tax=Paenibacillus woosongensis TaxID=307580 RepID=A0ABQ4MUX8_9BACL|nr:hypothetical protein J15TS10_35530 [Paenibacillus woosongensis]
MFTFLSIAVAVVVVLVVTAIVFTGGVAGAVLLGAACGAVGATLANDLARREWSSGGTYLRSAVTGGIGRSHDRWDIWTRWGRGVYDITPCYDESGSEWLYSNAC